VHEGPGRAEPRLEGAVRDGDDGLLAVHGLADHAGQEGGRGGRGRAGPHGDGREAQREARDEPAARVLVDQGLADELLRAVRGLRRRGDAVVDDLGQRLPVDGLARRVDDPDAGDDPAQRVQQAARGVDVDAHAQLEVGLRARRHDAVEGVHGVEGLVHDRVGAIEEVRLDDPRVLGVLDALGNRGLVDVGKGDLVRLVVEQFFGQELADEARGAGDQDVHFVTVRCELRRARKAHDPSSRERLQDRYLKPRVLHRSAGGHHTIACCPEPDWKIVARRPVSRKEAGRTRACQGGESFCSLARTRSWGERGVGVAPTTVSLGLRNYPRRAAGSTGPLSADVQ